HSNSEGTSTVRGITRSNPFRQIGAPGERERISAATYSAPARTSSGVGIILSTFTPPNRSDRLKDSREATTGRLRGDSFHGNKRCSNSHELAVRHHACICPNNGFGPFVRSINRLISMIRTHPAEAVKRATIKPAPAHPL